MTSRELHLRARIDVLTDERDEARAAPPTLPRLRRRCVYCGNPCRGWLTCRAHMDLPSLDAFYMVNERVAA